MPVRGFVHVRPLLVARSLTFVPDPSEQRLVEVPPERLPGWLARFAERHGEPSVSSNEDGQTVELEAPDGAVATVEVPFPPLAAGAGSSADLLAHVGSDRTVGVLLVRRGGYAVGRFVGRELAESKVGSSYVQGRSKAGGWSQQRFARRRANQARGAYEDAADVAARILLPRAAELAALVTGGDKAGLRQVLADPRLEPLRALVLPRVLSVPDPRLAVLSATPDQFLAVRIRLNASA